MELQATLQELADRHDIPCAVVGVAENRQIEAAAFYPLIFLPFLSSAFVPTATMLGASVSASLPASPTVAGSPEPASTGSG